MPYRYAELTPTQLQARWSIQPTAVLPIGALEWHGDHLPFGTDGFLAEAFAKDLAERLGAVLLPTFWTPITTLPHPSSLQVPTEAFRMILDSTLEGLARSGARTIAIVTGHYAQGHSIELSEAALRAMDDHPDLCVLAATPLEPCGDEGLLDHAGRWETAQMRMIRPDLVREEAFAQGPSFRTAVLGESPSSGVAEEARSVWNQALDAWCALLAGGSEAAEDFAQGVFDRYQPYVDTWYEGSWEDAIIRWWAAKTPTENAVEDLPVSGDPSNPA